METDHRAQHEHGPEDVQHRGSRLDEVQPVDQEQRGGELGDLAIANHRGGQQVGQQDSERAEGGAGDPPADRRVAHDRHARRDQEETDRWMIPGVPYALPRGGRAPKKGVGVAGQYSPAVKAW